MSWDADVTVVGAGAAGLSLAVGLARPIPGERAAPRVVVVEAPPGQQRSPKRTWCYWEAGGGAYDHLLAASWKRLRVYAPDGRVIDRPLGPMRYKMLRSDRFEAAMTERLGEFGVGLRQLTVESASDAAGGAVVRGRDVSGAFSVLRSGIVFDSRPLRRLPAARTTLLQHFRGWFVRTARAVFDPGAAILMDFRLPQPSRGLAFGYVLPLGPCEALVEYTQFSPAALDEAAYERALRHYCTSVLGLGDYTVWEREQGVIPMSDGIYPRRNGRRVYLIGAAGGATRPSTGYTFAAIQRQSRHLAEAVRSGRSPARVPAVHGRRARAMDAVLLRALDSGRVDGGAFFADLFASAPADRILRFLDGATSPWEDFGIGLRTPVLPMLRSLVELPFLLRTVPAAGPGHL
ncbi:lycopene cyclase family protein [Streptomyces sp. NBC_01294]|uniref:lycopene cyclase family protein n=1 Tax=Streptomyces sp. NBC_01294 TaxID=2903815 RepID=UPI002DD7B82E|nr:lycopene cyclase family protein [Streptomyces sp. NBC_01294]WRZ61100.1 lycopene cyclase family protein [Streptomyces sp. NBC_01294]